MGQDISINPERIEQHGQEVGGTITDELKKAQTELNTSGTIEGGDFSVTGTAASVMYPMGLQFAFEDLDTHLDMLKDYAQKLATTAKNYDGAELASKIKPV